MNRKRLFQIIFIALILVGAVYFLSVAVRAGRVADGVGEGDALAAYLPAAATKQDLTFEVVDYRQVGDEAQFDVKFPLVDERDWQIRNVVYLEIDGEQYPLRATELVEIVRPPVDGTGEAFRVDTLTFADVPVDLDQRDFTLMIKEINTMPNEGGYCDPSLVQSIQEPMAEAFPGIEIVCVSEPGFDGFEIAPDSVYANDANALELLGSVVSHALNGWVIGLWEFSFGG
jgi:hypothetical protein